MTEPQDYLDLDAAGFLLVALGHLVKARDMLQEMPKSARVWRAERLSLIAANHTRYALRHLKELKEETCEKS